MQLNAGDGPCVECVSTGEVVSVADVRVTGGRWPGFREAALLEGFQSAHAVPLRVRSDVIGSLGVLRTSTGPLAPEDAVVARALADIASIGILQERVLRESAIVAEQLQRALDSRVLIEQAKGVLAALHDLDMNEAFQVIRDHARRNNLNLHVVAQGVIDRSIDIARATAHHRRPAGVVLDFSTPSWRIGVQARVLPRPRSTRRRHRSRLDAEEAALAAWVATKAVRRAAATVRRSRATQALQPEATGARTPG